MPRGLTIALATIALLAMSGCVQREFREASRNYLGQNVDELIAAIGPPTSESDIGDTGWWTLVWLAEIPSYARHDAPYGIDPNQYYCRMQVELNGDGTIADMDIQGSYNGCLVFLIDM